MQILKASPATAYEIAKAAGVPRANTYAGAGGAGAARRRAAGERRAAALRRGAAEDSVRKHFQADARAVQRSSARLSALTPADQDAYVWTAHGDMAVQDKIEAMIAESRRSIWIKAADEVIRRHKSSLQKAAARGVALMVVLFGNDADEFRFNAIAASISTRATAPAWARPTTCSPSRSTTKRC